MFDYTNDGKLTVQRCVDLFEQSDEKKNVGWDKETATVLAGLLEQGHRFDAVTQELDDGSMHVAEAASTA